MKILTLNLHCFAEDSIQKNQKIISDVIKKEDIDIIFFQEVAQSANLDVLFDGIKKDNYGYIIKTILDDLGSHYYYHYATGNRAFGIYDEGLSILSKTKLYDKNHFFVSKVVDYEDWSTRVIVSAKTDVDNQTFTLTSAHFGWTNDVEVFEDQVTRTLRNLNPKETHIIAGDFNINPGSTEYEFLINNGFVDLYYSNEEKYFNDPTHLKNINDKSGLNRIDYIMSNKTFKVRNRKILFKDKQVSDHFGVLLELEI